MGELLNSPDYLDTISTLGTASDIELLLDFILCVRKISTRADSILINAVFNLATAQ